MTVEPVQLLIDEFVPKPPKMTMCHPIPVHWEEQGAKILYDLLLTGIIEHQHGDSDFILMSFFVKKGDSTGDPRLVVNYSNSLNVCIKRVPHPLSAPISVWAQVKAGSTHFLSVDLKSAFWQLPLSEKSKDATTLMGPIGLCKWVRCPMVASSSPDYFNKECEVPLSSNPKGESR